MTVQITLLGQTLNMTATFAERLDQLAKGFQEANTTMGLITDQVGAVQVRLNRTKKTRNQRLQHSLLLRVEGFQGVSRMYKEYARWMAEKVKELEWQQLTRDVELLLRNAET